MINYYTISSENAKKYYQLEKPNGYYDYEKIKKEAMELYENNEEMLKKIKENMNVFNNVMEMRKERETLLREKLDFYGIRFIPHSYLTRRYIMHNYLGLKKIVRELYKMHILFTKCDIKNNWEEYKKNKGEGFYSMEEKDKFYETIYQNYIKENKRYQFK